MRELIRWMEDHMAEREIPGAALAVVHGGDTFVATMGQLELGGACPVTADTRFSIGKVGRVVTNIALLDALRDRDIDLHSPLTEHLTHVPFQQNSRYPEFGDRDSVTIHQLMTWSAGIPSRSLSILWAECELSLAAWAEHPPGADPLDKFELRFPPGSLSSFSASEVNLAGRLLEAVDDRPYAEALQARVFDQLGMESAEVNVPHRSAGPIAQPHVKNPRVVAFDATEFDCPANAPRLLVWLSANDAAALLEMLARGETSILDEEDLENIAAVEDAPGDPRYSTKPMGYALHTTNDGLLGPKVGWISRSLGYSAALQYYPDYSFGYFVAFNLLDGSTPTANDARYQRDKKIVETFFPDADLHLCYCREHPEKCGVSAGVSCTNPDKLKRDIDRWEELYTGTYESTKPNAKIIRVSWNDARRDLRFQYEDGRAWPAIPIGKDVFTVDGGELQREPLSFHEDAAGNRWLVRMNGSPFIRK